MDPITTALVMIKYQNDFASPGGVFYEAFRPMMDSTQMLPNSVSLLTAARVAGVLIMHTPITFAEGYAELAAHPYGILKGVVDNKAFRKGSWGAALYASVTPLADDTVIEGKRGLDAFASTNLDFILRSKGVKTVVLCGF